MFSKPRLFVRRFLKIRSSREDQGATVIEYALLISLIATVAVGSLTLLGYSVNHTVASVGAEVGARPGLTVSAPANGITGSPIALTGSLMGAKGTPGGTISFSFTRTPTDTAPASCTTTSVGTSGVNGGAAHSSYTPGNTGTYYLWWYATYSGDANNNPADSTCGASVTAVGLSHPQLAISAYPVTTPSTPWPLTSPITTSDLEATLTSLSSSGSGAVNFWVSGPGNQPGTCPNPNGGGGGGGWHYVGGNNASFGQTTYNSGQSFTPAAAGTYWWYVTFTSNGNDPSVGTTCGGAQMDNTVVGSAVQPTLTLTAPATWQLLSTPNAIPAANVFARLARATTGGGGSRATGTITFYVTYTAQDTAPASCTASATTVGVDNLPNNGNPNNATYNYNGLENPGTAGYYWFYAVYTSTNPADSSATTTCGGTGTVTLVNTTVNTQTLTLTVTGNYVAGANVPASSISGNLTGSNSSTNPTGTITFYVSGPTTDTSCSTITNWASETLVGTASVSGEQTYPPTGGGYTLAGGTTGAVYWWEAYYGGDPSDTSVWSNCVSTIVKATPVLTITDAPGTGRAGTYIPPGNFSATLAGSFRNTADTAQINFWLYGPSSTPPSTCPAGTSTSFPGLWNQFRSSDNLDSDGTYNGGRGNGVFLTQGGDYWWFDTYTGDNYNNAVTTSPCGPGMDELTMAYTPTLTINVTGTYASGNLNVPENDVTATLAASNPSPPSDGTVTFYASTNGTQLPFCDRTQPFTIVGTNNSVSGDNTYAAGLSTSPPYSVTAGEYYYWYAVYNPGTGDTTDQSATSNCFQMAVKNNAVTLAITIAGPPPSTPGSSATINLGQQVTIAETGLPTGGLGQVTLTASPGQACTIFLLLGNSCSYTPAATGPYTITGSYAGNALNGAATSKPVSLTVDQAPAITSANNVNFTPGTLDSFSVTTAGYPTPAISDTCTPPGWLTFTDNHNGTATISGTPPGTGSVTVCISASNVVSTATQTLTILAAYTPKVTVTGSPVGTTVTFNAIVSGTAGTPGGTVTWTAESYIKLFGIEIPIGPVACNPASGPLGGGIISCQVTGASGLEQYTATASYGGNPPYAPAQGTSSYVTG